MRPEGWESRLFAAIEAARNKPFVWGEHDCALFAANVIKEMMGVDVAAPWRGYTTEFGARRIIAEAGGMEALASVVFGETLVTPKLAQRGDLLIVDSIYETWDGAFAICGGPTAAMTGLNGLVFVPMAMWRAAWRVR